MELNFSEITLPVIALWGIGLGAAFVGAIIGYFAFYENNARKININEAKVEKRIQDAEIKMREAENKIALTSQALPDDPGLLRLKNNKGSFMLEMDGTPINGALSPEKKKRLIDLITIIRPWLEGGLPPQVSPILGQPAKEVTFQLGAFSYIQQPEIPATGKKPEVDIKSLSIVQQIDTVLQARLVNTPYAKSGIRLQESLQGEVEVYVGSEKFFSVDDVTDTAIKAVIRAAITEWEEKYTPGL